jgi:hypothetical protein
VQVAGSFQVRISFEIQHPKFGVHRCVELLPVFVPTLQQ